MVYGARTLGGDDNGEFRYINVRRFMNFLKESIDEGTQFVVFEPNSPALWQRIIRSRRRLPDQPVARRRAVRRDAEAGVLRQVRRRDQPAGASAKLGQVVTEIGVAIVKPAEFVIFRIQQTDGS